MAVKIDELKTLRLFLRGIDATDTEKIVEWRSIPHVYQYFKFPHRITIDEHLKWFNNSYKNNPCRFDWMCLELSTGQKIGVFGLIKEENTAEINYILAPKAQHKGYAKEAIKRLISYAEKEWLVDSIKAEIHKDNTPSIALIEKLGFIRTASDGDFVLYQLELKH